MTGNGEQPATKIPPVLFAETQPLVEAIQARAGGALVCYWNSPTGSICQSDVQAFYEVLEQIGPHETLYLFLKSHGGDGTASLRIVNLLHRYGRRVVVLLPLECASAATMIALGAHEIRMGPIAHLTAVDTALIHELSPLDQHNRQVSVSQDELNRVVNLWRQEARESPDPGEGSNPYSALFPHVHPLVIGAVDRSSSLSVKLCSEILGFHLEDPEEAQRISVHLNSSYPAHSYPILHGEARRIGLNVTDLDPTLNSLLLDLHEKYSEMGQEAVTYFDRENSHNNEIVNIIESAGVQVHFQVDQDWHYRTEERRWVPMNDSSRWTKVERVGEESVQTVFHAR